MSQCNYCQKPLTGQRRKYCNDGCSQAYISRDVSNQRKKANMNIPQRYCKYENCKAPLDIGENKLKYCRNADCSRKQNAIDAKRKRDVISAKKFAKFKVCELISCGKEFKVDRNKPRKMYCTDKCRHKALHYKCPDCDKEILKTSKYCNSCAKIQRVGKPRKAEYKPLKSALDAKYLTRGKISYSGYREI